MNDNAQVVDKQESTPNVIKEERLLDEKVEEAGCRKIIESLSEEEKEMMSDDRMPMRYFRAEKVSDIYLMHVPRLWILVRII